MNVTSLISKLKKQPSASHQVKVSVNGKEYDVNNLQVGDGSVVIVAQVNVPVQEIVEDAD